MGIGLTQATGSCDNGALIENLGVDVVNSLCRAGSAALLLCASCITTGAEAPDGHSYNLSMAGALINDWCGRQWQAAGYISIHACTYEVAQLYNLEVSSGHFTACAEQSGGDIVQIADCMVNRFGAWAQVELAPPAQ